MQHSQLRPPVPHKVRQKERLALVHFVNLVFKCIHLDELFSLVKDVTIVIHKLIRNNGNITIAWFRYTYRLSSPLRWSFLPSHP